MNPESTPDATEEQELQAALAYAELQGGEPNRLAIIDRMWAIAEADPDDDSGQNKTDDCCERILARAVRQLQEELKARTGAWESENGALRAEKDTLAEKVVELSRGGPNSLTFMAERDGLAFRLSRVLAELAAAQKERDEARQDRDDLESSRGDWVRGAKCPTCKGYGEVEDARTCSSCAGTGGVWMTWRQRAEQAELDLRAAREALRRVFIECGREISPVDGSALSNIYTIVRAALSQSPGSAGKAKDTQVMEEQLDAFAKYVAENPSTASQPSAEPNTEGER